MGLKFVQWGINHSEHKAIKMTPYEAVFGEKAQMGLSAILPKEFLCKITPGMREEEFEDFILEQPSDSSPTPVSFR